MKGRVLIIAGSDPSGGAGIQADIKTVTALGGYAAAAITALTVQNTLGVRSIHAVSAEVIRAQIVAVLEDIGADAIKIGMIGSVEAADAIVDALSASRRCDTPPVVLDPVLVATSGHALAGAGLVERLKARLIPMARVVTPNAPEAEALTGTVITDEQSQARAAATLLALGAEAALVKGGHLGGPEVCDHLTTRDGDVTFRNSRIETKATHGTGCTLASAIATGLAQGLTLEAATARAIAYVRDAIRSAPGFGAGAGPLNHAHSVAGLQEPADGWGRVAGSAPRPTE